MFVLSTAGHVDHGKSTLIEALTGMHVDRLPEEKKRGMTIELNFAWFDSDDGKVGIVDVPGHKRYIKNMVVGSEQVDAFLFIVAADDGWMPQSEEHLRILEAFGIDQGIIVLTKTDLVDSDHIKEVREDVLKRFKETFSKTFEIFEFQKDHNEMAKTIRQAINKLQKTSKKVSPSNSPRLWVDRSFSPRGLGLIVSGTLREGKIALGDKLVAWPSGENVSVRGIEAYKEKKEKVLPVSRVALQLSQGSISSIGRGSILSERSLETVSGIQAELKYFAKPFLKNTHLKLYLGTLEAECHLIPLKKEAANIVRIRFKEKIPIRVGDRFVLRLFGEERTIAGGRVLEFFPKKKLLPVTEKKIEKSAVTLSLAHEQILQKAGVPFEAETSEKKLIQELVTLKLLKALQFPFFISQSVYEAKCELVKSFLKQKGEATTSELKDILALSRKPAVLLLEKMDQDRLTYLKGGVRKLLRD